MSVYCTVNGCQHSDNHNVLGHKCRKCNTFGHGIIECGTDTLLSLNPQISQLKIREIPENIQCDIKTCRYKTSHTRNGHMCRLCDGYGHGITECIFTKANHIASLYPPEYLTKVYVSTYGGMGSLRYSKFDGSSVPLESYLMRGDDWGQYGSSEVPTLMKFLDGYKPLREVDKSML